MGIRFTSYIEPPASANNLHASFEPHFAVSSLNSRLLETADSGGSSMAMTRTRRSTLRRAHKDRGKKFITYGCRHCRTHLSSSVQIISKDYRGRTGDAYLMSSVLNVIEDKVETRSMLTGEYLVCDILCHLCKKLIGWKYLRSDNKDQNYKEGKYILELQEICKCH
ncbi:hypothetical protein KAFR_0B00580 [Kazachstania africana CBS 2517]|uniref:Protein yippee-like n=1 Tax=Kazachstania africana (strain ATCC 22294 / BCRC 22015 / CBS 2517 / CECT 1963 / NBRC 1671 / NRRL Y-8276) TaxID=1071382 RepID=H2APQ7_KAZAF|nr:hypothetical protein KAFR_0B00580 [Kazachstania africana CBS 2517]CCF56357.1 hypothetical protein KAFR_0B00580 [Kazachstania africana CBS 2517]